MKSIRTMAQQNNHKAGIDNLNDASEENTLTEEERFHSLSN